MAMALVKRVVNVVGLVKKQPPTPTSKPKRHGKLAHLLIVKQEMLFTNWAVIWIEGNANFSIMKVTPRENSESELMSIGVPLTGRLQVIWMTILQEGMAKLQQHTFQYFLLVMRNY